MSLCKFAYHGPDTLDEVLALLAAHGPAARVMAGGTDLVVKMSRGQVAPAVVIGLKRVPGLGDLHFDPVRGLELGCMTRVSAVLEHPAVAAHYPALAEAAQATATVQIRNMATIAGNLCNASPCADNAPTLVARGASVELRSPRGHRALPLAELFRGPGQTVLAPDELLVRITVPPPRAATGFAYLSLSQRSAVDVSAVGVAAGLTLADGRVAEARIVLGAVAPTPFVATAAADALRGRNPDDAAFRAAGAAAAEACAPIGDVRASAGYRRKMVAVLVRRALERATARALGEGTARAARQAEVTP
ncbi:MAG: xanthine dehydrogenase family protein subunit M [Polyangiaceae bacterium]|nr:xanthine dehydrogenase family protein subunit M [Polyangiaceae bacterium]